MDDIDAGTPTVQPKQACSLDLASLPWRVQSCVGSRRVTLARRRPHDCIKETSQDLGLAFLRVAQFSCELTAGLESAIEPRELQAEGEFVRCDSPR